MISFKRFLSESTNNTTTTAVLHVHTHEIQSISKNKKTKKQKPRLMDKQTTRLAPYIHTKRSKEEKLSSFNLQADDKPNNKS